MFTGIIEETGQIEYVNSNSEKYQIGIKCEKVLEKTVVGDSIAVNGICLTVTKMWKNGFEADVMSETLKRTGLKESKKGTCVNLERAMAADGRFGGHIVSGHIDGTGLIKNIREERNAVWYEIFADKKTIKYVVEKGSITIDGISLTVAYVDEKGFKVSTIPHTRESTNLKDKNVGDTVNLECDIIGKYVEKLLGYSECNEKKESKITESYLIENGF
ncbi:riboflavin synthase [Eubacterium sp. LMAG:50]|uniref:riboflavin synthase n=1 Tax=Eubacterium sp. LMAG:50 TaxID=1969563 RepID=UPI0025BDFE8F|nr:riboflavin synthase [Eubacterium sp. LMAG:50]